MRLRVGTLRTVSFESDLAELRERPLSAPTTTMRVRHERRADPSSSPVQMLSGDRSAWRQVVALYGLSAVPGSKPVVVAEVDPLADLEAVEQGAAILVRGWPVVGRAVTLDFDGHVVEATYPCVSPAFRPMRFK